MGSVTDRVVALAQEVAGQRDEVADAAGRAALVGGAGVAAALAEVLLGRDLRRRTVSHGQLAAL